MGETVFDKMELSMLDMVKTVREFHGEYIVGGLFLGLTNPPMGWALLGLITALPTIVILKHPEWLNALQKEKVEYVLLFMLLILSSDMYVGHCLGKAFGIRWP